MVQSGNPRSQETLCTWPWCKTPTRSILGRLWRKRHLGIQGIQRGLYEDDKEEYKSSDFFWWRRRTRNSTYWHVVQMRGFGLTSLVVCTNGKTRDRRGRNTTIRSKIWTKDIHSLGFHDIREWVTLWRLILRSLGCRQ